MLVTELVLSLCVVSLISCQHTQLPGVKAPSDRDNLSFPWSRLRLPRLVYKHRIQWKRSSLPLSSASVLKVNLKATFAYLQVPRSSSLPALAASQSDDAHIRGLRANSDRCAKQHKLGCVAQQGFTNCQGHYTGSELRTFIWPGNC